ncbi:MAG TPA: hypothetical protein GXZ27_07195 [Thermoanaerobacterales bacterium]|jgi:hypothetical protein|nr:hypothetical protein [Thermoanaerobacterales bacterium]
MLLSIAGKTIDGFYREITEIYPIALVAILKQLYKPVSATPATGYMERNKH